VGRRFSPGGLENLAVLSEIVFYSNGLKMSGFDFVSNSRRGCSMPEYAELHHSAHQVYAGSSGFTFVHAWTRGLVPAKPGTVGVGDHAAAPLQGVCLACAPLLVLSSLAA
jgi:hypothetical protein